MSDTFDKAYELVLGHEGGYSNDVDDPGGETYKGIARNRWPSWRGWIVIDDMKREYGHAFERWLNDSPRVKAAIREFYRLHFWDTVWGDEIAKLSPELAIDLFDMSVNLGTGRATEFIQRACNVLNNRQRLYADILVDGAFGPKTMKAVRSCIGFRSAELLYKVVNILQGAWYIELMERSETFEKYSGWFKRVDFIQGEQP